MNLKAKTIRVVTTDDLELYCNPPLTFEASGRINDKLTAELQQWFKTGYDPAKTVEFIPQLFMSVSQNGDAYPLTTQADAEALREALGEGFLLDLVEAFWDYDYRFFARKRLVSANSSTAQGAGEANSPSP